MDESNRVIEQANSFMHRHGHLAVPAAEDGTGGDEDLPLLTDIVTNLHSPTPEAVMPEPPSTAILPPDRVEALAREMLFDRLPRQRQALAEELAAWLDDALPQIILRVLDGVTDQLIEQVTAEARAILLPKLQMVIEDESQPSRNAG